MTVRSAEADRLIHELTLYVLGAAIGLSASVAEEFDSLAARGLFGWDKNAQKYRRLFSNGPPKTSTTNVNQMTLCIGALSFFLHAIDRLSYRQNNEVLREAIFDHVAIALSKAFAEMLNKYGVKTTETETLHALQGLHLRYAAAPTLLGGSAQNKNSAVWLAANAIAADVGHPSEVFPTLVFGELLSSLNALDLANRIAAVQAAL